MLAGLIGDKGERCECWPLERRTKIDCWLDINKSGDLFRNFSLSLERKSVLYNRVKCE